MADIIEKVFSASLTSRELNRLLDPGNCRECGKRLPSFRRTLCQSCQMREEEFHVREEEFHALDSKMQSYFKQGIELADLNISDEAVEAFENGVLLQKQFGTLYYHFGYAFFNEGENAKAVLMLKKAIDLQQKNTDLYLLLGQALERCNQLEDAIDAYRKAVDLAEDNYLCHYHLGRALAKGGQIDSAINAYRQSVHLYPGFADAFYEMGSVMYSTKNILKL